VNLATGTSTQTLTTAQIELSSDQRWRVALLAIAIAALLLLAGIAGGRVFADGSAATARRAELRRENSELRAQLERAQLELDLERSMREALDMELQTLNERIGELRGQLDFVHAQGGRSPAGEPSN